MVEMAVPGAWDCLPPRASAAAPPACVGAHQGNGDIFLAWSDEPWVLDGAAVHISFLGFDDGAERRRQLNGMPVASINANLTSGIDLTRARRLPQNRSIAFMGDTKGGPFDISAEVAERLLASPTPTGVQTGTWCVRG